MLQHPTAAHRNMNYVSPFDFFGIFKISLLLIQ